MAMGASAKNTSRTSWIQLAVVIATVLSIPLGSGLVAETGAGSPRLSETNMLVPCPAQCRCDDVVKRVTCAGQDLGNLTSVDFPRDVRFLELPSNGINAIVGDQFSALTDLVRLDLSNNELTGDSVSPDVFVGNPNLQVLILRNNRLGFPRTESRTVGTPVNSTGGNDTFLPPAPPAPPSFLQRLPASLQKLDLSYNGLAGEGGAGATVQWPLAFTCPERDQDRGAGCTPALQGLDLSWNQLPSLPPGVNNQQLPNLATLNLTGNHITSESLVRRDAAAAVTPNAGNNSIGNTDVTLQSGSHSDSDASWGRQRPTSPSPLRAVVLAHNHITHLTCDTLGSFTGVELLDLSDNLIRSIPVDGFCAGDPQHDQPPSWTNLTTLNLQGNPLQYIFPDSLARLTHLKRLDLSHLQNLSFLEEHTFQGLDSLEILDLSRNPNLEYIHANSFSALTSLLDLDISNSGLETLHETTFQNLTARVAIQGNPWHCDCDLQWLSYSPQPPAVSGESMSLTRKIAQQVICQSPPHVSGAPILNLTTSDFVCEQAHITNHTLTANFSIGSEAMLDCVTSGSPRPQVTWTTPRGEVFRFHPGYVDQSRSPAWGGYHGGHVWHQETSYRRHWGEGSQRVAVLANGSLYLDYVTRLDAGNYTCVVHNPLGNDTVTAELLLDYSVFKSVMVWSVLVGFVAAVGFLFVAVIVAVTRYICFRCSSKEKTTRKSIREVLGSLHDFKITQIHRLKGYKTAKIDQLSAFKSAKKEQFVAFKTAKIDKLRTYKQVTVASVFHHMERMRVHYNSQMDKVKENCSQQAEKLRENYSGQFAKLKGYRAERIDRLRDNYANQVVKIREYGASQLEKLREQYKLQHQHLLKLMELLDIGNCLTVIEAECMRTESMIFDPNITFDLEAQPAHPPRECDSDAESEYHTAGSHSEGSSLSIHIDAGMDVCAVTLGSVPPTEPRPSHRGGAAAPQPREHHHSHHGKHARRKKRHKRRRAHAAAAAAPLDLAAAAEAIFGQGRSSRRHDPGDSDDAAGERLSERHKRLSQLFPLLHLEQLGSLELDFVDCTLSDSDEPPVDGAALQRRPSNLSLDEPTLEGARPAHDPEFNLRDFRKRSLSESISTEYGSAMAFSPSREMTPGRDSASDYESAVQFSRDRTPEVTDNTLTPSSACSESPANPFSLEPPDSHVIQIDPVDDSAQ